MRYNALSILLRRHVVQIHIHRRKLGKHPVDAQLLFPRRLFHHSEALAFLQLRQLPLLLRLHRLVHRHPPLPLKRDPLLVVERGLAVVVYPLELPCILRLPLFDRPPHLFHLFRPCLLLLRHKAHPLPLILLHLLQLTLHLVRLLLDNSSRLCLERGGRGKGSGRDRGDDL